MCFHARTYVDELKTQFVSEKAKRSKALDTFLRGQSTEIFICRTHKIESLDSKRVQIKVSLCILRGAGGCSQLTEAVGSAGVCRSY